MSDVINQLAGIAPGSALDRARDELSGLPLSGLLVVSDGADTADNAFEASISQLKAQGVPVFAIGLRLQILVIETANGHDHIGGTTATADIEAPFPVLDPGDGVELSGFHPRPA